MTHKVKGTLNVAYALEMAPISAPSPSQGLIYFDQNETKLKVSQDGSSFVNVGDVAVAEATALAALLNSTRATIPATDTGRTPGNVFFDKLVDNSKISLLTNTAIFAGSTIPDMWIQNDLDSTTATRTEDFTGGAVDSNYTLNSGPSGQTIAFDSANDEVDMTSNCQNSGEVSQSSNYNVDSCIIIAKFRNCTWNVTYAGLNIYVGLKVNGQEIRYQYGNNGATSLISSPGGSNTNVGAPSAISFKVERRGKLLKFYYDTSGGETWTLHGTEYTGGSDASSSISCTHGTTNGGSVQTVSNCSLWSFRTFEGFIDGGTIETTTTTVPSASTSEIDYVDVTHTGNTALKIEVSHNNGSSYTTLANSIGAFRGSGKISVAGTTLKKKYTLTNASGISPKIYGHANSWNE